jgi:hypothetical protein
MKVFAASFVALAMCAAGAGQSVVWEHWSPNSTVTTVDYHWGKSILMPGDLNFDGVKDVLVSSPTSPNGAQINAGYVGILSGIDGAPIYELHGPGGGLLWFPGLRCEGLSSDVDGDGATDFWVSYVPAPQANAVSVLLSGATGTPIPNPPTWAGPSYQRVGDVSGDGIDDLVNLGPPLTAYAGPTFTSILWSLPVPTASPTCLGRVFRSVVRMGDVDGDGIADLLAGVSDKCLGNCQSAPGSAHVVSGATGMILQQWNGAVSCDHFGWQVASPGDLDGDAIPDAVVDVPGSMFLGTYGTRSFSTATGSQIASYGGAAWVTTYPPPHGLVALGDVDGDGFPEFALQGPDAAHVEVVSGATGGILSTLNPPAGIAYPALGDSLVTPGDVNGDGVPELVLGVSVAGLAGTLPPGRVRMYSLAPVGITTFGSGCPQSNGKLPRIGASHQAQSGQPFTLNLSVVPPNLGALAMFGLSNTMNGTTPLPWNLSGLGLPSCSLLVSMDFLFTMSTTQIRPGEGAASVTPGIPTGLTGLTFYAQWAISNPFGAPAPASLSRALAVTIQ